MADMQIYWQYLIYSGTGSRIAVFLPKASFRIARRFNREKTIEFVVADYEAVGSS
jgi:hypothetical protein